MEKMAQINGAIMRTGHGCKAETRVSCTNITMDAFCMGCGVGKYATMALNVQTHLPRLRESMNVVTFYVPLTSPSPCVASEFRRKFPNPLFLLSKSPSSSNKASAGIFAGRLTFKRHLGLLKDRSKVPMT